MADIESQISGVTMEQPTSTTENPQLPQRVAIAAVQPITTTENLQPTTPNSADAQPQATTTNDSHPPHGNAPLQTAGNPDSQQGEKYGDSSDGVWSMYLVGAEEEDKNVTESWKGDTNGILLFTGVFSATIAAFIIESYKKLSPDSTDKTNALLTQISQQLVNISNGTPLTSAAAQTNQPFKPTASAVRVNVLFFLSLVLSLTCALSATLMQQWARRYQELVRHTGAPHKRGRIRACVFHGIRRFGMARAIATMPLLLHASVFLFFAGLLDFLFPINKTVSYTTLACVVAFALTYAILTILPNFYFDCPYATPLSGITWRLSQVFVIVGLKAALGIEDLLHNPLLKLWSQVNQHITGPSVQAWRESLKSQVKVHRQWLSDGLRRSVERSSKDAPSMAITTALEWTLTAMDEEEEIETFAERMPGFFDSRKIPDPTLAILPLMSKKKLTDSILGTRLYDLLKISMPGTLLLDDEQRMSRLQVCLKCLCYFGKAYNQSGVSEPLPSYFPTTISSPEIIQFLQKEQDPIIRVMGRCFGALVLTKLAAGVTSSTDSDVQIDEEQLACLSAIIGIKSSDVRLCLSQPGVVQLASMVSLALSDVTFISAANALPSDVLDVVQQTLKILSETFPAEVTIKLPPDWPNSLINISGSEYDRIIVSRLGYLLRMCVSGPLTLTDDVRGSCLQMSLKSLWYYAKVYHQLDTSKSLPPYFLNVLATPEITNHIQREEDLTSRVIGYCFEALVVTKLAADFTSGGIHVSNTELTCLSAIFGTERHVVEIWLKLPGAIEHMSLFFLVLSVGGALDPTLPRPTPTPTLFSYPTAMPTRITFPTPRPTVYSNPAPHPPIFPPPMPTTSPNSNLVFPMPLPATLPDPTDPPVPTPPSWTGDREQSDLWDTVQQTFSILSLSLPVGRNTQPSQWLDQAGSKFQTTLQLWLYNLLNTCTTAHPPPESQMRLGCLKSLWYHEIACHYLRAPGSLPALDSFPIHLITPEIASRIHTEEEISVRVIGRCFASLVMNRLAAKSKAFGDHEMAFLSAILRTERRAAIHRHFTAPGVVQLINVVFLLFGEFSFFATNTVPPYVLHIVGHTIGALIQALPAELSAELQLDRSESQMNVPDSQIKSVIVSHLRDLFKACTLRPFPLPEAVRTYCLKMCLYGLWRWGKALHQLGTSQQLPPEFLDLAGLEVTSHIRKETNQVTCMMGHCVQALVVVNLVVRIQSRNHSNPSDEELACISAILGTESHDLRLWFTLPGVVEFANVVSLVLTETEISFTDTSLSDVLDSDMIKQTIRILRWQLPPGLDAGLMKLSDGMYPPIYDSDSHSCICLKRLWQFARVYNGPEISTPLPPFVRTTLASPKFTRRLHAESDLPTRVIGRCVQALIVNKLVDDFQSRISLSIGVLDAELASISSILDIVPGEFSRWPRLSVVIKLQNVIFLMSGEIEDLFSSSATAPADVLYIVRKTLNAICSDLVLGGVFAGRDLPMDQVSSLREICSSIANARHPNRFDGRTVEILDRLQQISKQLPTVKHTIRRCTSTIFDSKSVRGRSDLTTRPEYEVRRRSGSV